MREKGSFDGSEAKRYGGIFDLHFRRAGEDVAEEKYWCKR